MTEVQIRRDVVYAGLPGFRPLALDVYAPRSPRLICLYLHGGGWRVGSRRAGPGPLSPTSGRLFERMAGSGVAIVSADYRLSGEAQFPAQPTDVAAAWDYVVANRDGLGLGDLPMAAFGVSAGGHLAALHALRGQAAPPVSSVALWYPVTDLLAMPDDQAEVGGDADRGPGSREAMLLGGPPADVPELAREASPVSHVRPGAPPFLLVHGDADLAVPPRQSARLAEALLAAGGTADLVTVPGQGHMFPTLRAHEVEALVDRTTDFLLSHAG